MPVSRENRKDYMEKYYAKNGDTIRKRSRDWHNENKEKSLAAHRAYYYANTDKFRIANKKWGEAHPERKLLFSVKSRAKRKGIPFDLTEDDILIPAVCPILGIQLVRNKGTMHSNNSPTVDRINNSKGYVKGNIMVISWRANRIKCDATPDELMAIAMFYSKLSGD